MWILGTTGPYVSGRFGGGCKDNVKSTDGRHNHDRNTARVAPTTSGRVSMQSRVIPVT